MRVMLLCLQTSFIRLYARRNQERAKHTPIPAEYQTAMIMNCGRNAKSVSAQSIPTTPLFRLFTRQHTDHLNHINLPRERVTGRHHAPAESWEAFAMAFATTCNLGPAWLQPEPGLALARDLARDWAPGMLPAKYRGPSHVLALAHLRDLHPAAACSDPVGIGSGYGEEAASAHFGQQPMKMNLSRNGAGTKAWISIVACRRCPVWISGRSRRCTSQCWRVNRR